MRREKLLGIKKEDIFECGIKVIRSISEALNQTRINLMNRYNNSPKKIRRFIVN